MPSLTFESWRHAARPLLAAAVPATDVDWLQLARSGSAPRACHPSEPEIRLPRELMRLLDNIACYRHAGRWELMYRLAWRARHENLKLLEDSADPDVAHALSMGRAVSRDIHKMHAFVRFRETRDPDGTARYFAWFEPKHEVLRKASAFFVDRFPNMRWSIATPDGAAVWGRNALSFVDSPPLNPALKDASDDLWRTYYRSICNVARINPQAMQREMPRHYWRNLPEASEIPNLLRNGLERFVARQSTSPPLASALDQAARRSLAPLQTTTEGGVQGCRRCELWKHATQGVEGQGADTARIMLVGEQPGEQEDLRGVPFVGPAGQILDAALRASGIERTALYITNAVKHFKWEPRGKRRLHKRPDLREIQACEFWLSAEIRRLGPRVIVALGATALRALTGRSMSIEVARNTPLTHAGGAQLIATYHPSAILRASDERALLLRETLIADLRRAVLSVP